MADPMTILTIASISTTLAGTAMAASGTIAAGKAAQQAANYQALQMEAAGKAEQAAGQQEAFQLKRKKKLALSALQGRQAASGFLPDPEMGEEIAEYGTFQEQMAQFGGRSRRAGLEDSAAAARVTGAAQAQGAKTAAYGTILGGAGSMFDAFSKPFGSPTAKSKSPYDTDYDQFAQVGLGRYY
jgi:hypothetical protein